MLRSLSTNISTYGCSSTGYYKYSLARSLLSHGCGVVWTLWPPVSCVHDHMVQKVGVLRPIRCTNYVSAKFVLWWRVMKTGGRLAPTELACNENWRQAGSHWVTDRRTDTIWYSEFKLFRGFTHNWQCNKESATYSFPVTDVIWVGGEV